MITLQDLTEKINKKLNVIKEDIDGLQDVEFMIYPDGDEYKGARLEKNVLEDNYIQGTAISLNSSIVPVDGIIIQTQTVGVEIVVPVKTGRELVEQEDGSSIMQDVVYQDSFEPIRKTLANYASQAYDDTIVETIDEATKTYKLTYTVTNPRAGDIMIRDQVGLSITYQVSFNFAIVQNGINSRDIIIVFEGKKVPFTNVTIGRTAVMESGAFNGSNCSALNYPAVTALSIELAVPALSNTIITSEHLQFILSGEIKTYRLGITFSGDINTAKYYNVHFGECCVAGQGIDNVGQSIRLVEALDLTED
jgi:hypothetical protein